MDVVQTQRRDGREWKAPYLPGDPPHHSPNVDIPVSAFHYDWEYSKSVNPMMASWHPYPDMFDQVRRRTIRIHPTEAVMLEEHSRRMACVSPSPVRNTVFQVIENPKVPETVDEGKDDSTEDETKQCPVCMENIKVVSGKCGHLLCFACSRKVRESSGKCPTCRERWIPTVKVYL